MCAARDLCVRGPAFSQIDATAGMLQVPYKQQEALGYITEVEEAMVNGALNGICRDRLPVAD